MNLNLRKLFSRNKATAESDLAYVANKLAREGKTVGVFVWNEEEVKDIRSRFTLDDRVYFTVYTDATDISKYDELLTSASVLSRIFEKYECKLRKKVREYWLASNRIFESKEDARKYALASRARPAFEFEIVHVREVEE